VRRVVVIKKRSWYSESIAWVTLGGYYLSWGWPHPRKFGIVWGSILIAVGLIILRYRLAVATSKTDVNCSQNEEQPMSELLFWPLFGAFVSAVAAMEIVNYSMYYWVPTTKFIITVGFFTTLYACRKLKTIRKLVIKTSIIVIPISGLAGTLLAPMSTSHRMNVIFRVEQTTLFTTFASLCAVCFLYARYHHLRSQWRLFTSEDAN
jgi:hypothetical protein